MSILPSPSMSPVLTPFHQPVYLSKPSSAVASRSLPARFLKIRIGPHSQARIRSEEHTSELQSQSNLVCRLLLEKKKKDTDTLLTNALLIDSDFSNSRTNDYIYRHLDADLM